MSASSPRTPPALRESAALEAGAEPRLATTKPPPRVSVLLPVYNAARYLAPAIESVLVQTYPHFEFVLIDDGSTDSSFVIAQEYARADSRIRLLRNPCNLGIVATRNCAFAEADRASAYFAVFDADDICMPDRLRIQVDFLETHPNHAIVGGHTLVIDEHGSEIGVRRYPKSHAEIVRIITRYSPIAHPTAMIRRTALEAVGGYREQYPRCHDYDLWLRMASHFEIANVDAFTLKYRISPNQGKRLHLRQSLKLTIALQRQWMRHGSFVNPLNIPCWGAEHLLLLLPSAVVLALFKRITYRRTR